MLYWVYAKKSSFFIALCLENHCQLNTRDKILKLSVLERQNMKYVFDELCDFCLVLKVAARGC
jgi:hypothetical protein